MSPVYKLELVPPKVKSPPGSLVVAEVSSMNLVNQNDISGEAHWLLFTSACQKGKALVEASDWNARPMMPATLPERREFVVCCALTVGCAMLVAK